MPAAQGRRQSAVHADRSGDGQIDSKDVVAGLEVGADEYLTKPLDQSALVARVKSMLRMKELTDQVRAQAVDLAAWNWTLEERVERQLTQIGRMDRMRRFLPPQVAELILSSGDDSVLDSHRRDVTVVFCDLRGFTAFSETSAPEEVMDTLREYHETVGAIIHKFSGTIEHFAGDGLMALLNDPVLSPPQFLHSGGAHGRSPGEMRVVDDPYGFGADIGDTQKSIEQDQERLRSLLRAYQYRLGQDLKSILQPIKKLSKHRHTLNLRKALRRNKRR